MNLRHQCRVRNIEIAWQEGCYKVMLLSGSVRTDAHRFYESIGFEGDSKKGFVAYPSADVGACQSFPRSHKTLRVAKSIRKYN